MRHASKRVLEELDQTEVEFEEPAPLSVKSEFDGSALRALPSGPLNPGVTIGTLSGFEETGAPLVTFVESIEGGPAPARSTVGLSIDQIGQEVVLVFEHGDLTKPIVLGCLLPRVRPLSAVVDKETLEFRAERQIVLRCGEASITLTCAGKVLIRGKYLLSSSSGVNLVKGGVIRLN